MAKTVAILGGGTAGLSAAHELIERGFDVDVYEKAGDVGGKARSNTKPGTGKNPRADLPGEHGFRFFPGFYRHLSDTMKRIPLPGGKTAFDNLVQAPRETVATKDHSLLVTPARFPQSWDDLKAAFKVLTEAGKFGISPDEVAWFVNRLLVLLTSCDDRRAQELDNISWLNFTDAAKRSKLFYRFFGVGMTRCMVACRADLVSARTAGTILLQLLFCMSSPFNQVDRLLCGPTNEVWIDPWEAYLKGRGVKFHPDSEATAFSYSGNHVDNLTIQHNQTATSETVYADYYISAVPVEVMQGLIASLKTADPNLSLIANLQTAWMNGIQFYLRHTLPVAQGHTIYLDSPWALTSIPQDKFWSRNVRHSYGNGKVSAILSVDISNWDEKGNNGKSAKECTADEIKDEVWLQMEQHLNKIKQPPILQTSNIMDWQLDPDIVFSGGAGNTTGKTENREPLLINTVGSLASRPEATTGIDNLFLASDYVRTYTDLATMEGANEAARRAVNGILEATNSSQSPCDVWPLSEPDFLVPFRVTDEVLFAMGQKNMFDVTYHQLTQNAVATTLKKIQSQVVGPYGPVLQALFNAAMNQLLQAI